MQVWRAWCMEENCIKYDINILPRDHGSGSSFPSSSNVHKLKKDWNVMQHTCKHNNTS
jgi:hypothetical protein